uniref:Uncharacterized protein n=1 Tax=Rhipicephalus zambeziensis TaxID=60191 RepID=A0A224Y691_9ACAR
MICEKMTSFHTSPPPPFCLIVIFKSLAASALRTEFVSRRSFASAVSVLGETGRNCSRHENLTWYHPHFVSQCFFSQGRKYLYIKKINK